MATPISFPISFKWTPITIEQDHFQIENYKLVVDMWADNCWYWSVSCNGKIIIDAQIKELWPKTKKVAKETCKKEFQKILSKLPKAQQPTPKQYA